MEVDSSPVKSGAKRSYPVDAQSINLSQLQAVLTKVFRVSLKAC